MEVYSSDISNDEIHELEISHYEGEIFVIENAKDIETAVAELKKQSVLGFDTETKPSFKKGETHKTSLLQLSGNGKVFLFRLLSCGIPESLKSLLEDNDILKAGVAIKDDLRKLQKIKPFKPAGFVELQTLSTKLGIESNGLRKLAAIVLGIRISKGQQLSNWEADRLSEQQIIYAATDAWVSAEIYKKLRISTNWVNVEKDGES